MTNEAVKTNQEEKEFKYKNQDMTYSELVMALDIADLPEHDIAERINWAIESGIVHELTIKQGPTKAETKFQKGVDALRNLGRVTAMNKAAVTQDRARRIENEPLEPIGNFTIAQQLDAEKMAKYLDNLGIEFSVDQNQQTYVFVFTIFNYTRDEDMKVSKYLNSLERGAKIAKGAKSAANYTSVMLRGAVKGTGEITAAFTRIAVDIVGQTGQGVMKILATTTVSATENFARAAHELNNDETFAKAKVITSKATNSIRGFFGGRAKGSRISK